MNRIFWPAFLGLCLGAGITSPGRGADEGPGQTLPPDVLPGAVFIPTPHDVVAKMLELAAVGKDDVVYDLGCGDGRIVIAAAKKYGCRAVGVDIDPMRVEESRKNVKRNQVGHLVRIEQGDIYDVDLRPASVVTLYLGTSFNKRLLPQLAKLEPGSRIVSHQFGIPGVKPQKTVRLRSKEDPHVHVLFLWTAPLDGRE
jgi:SAM-dependent methyltransferase